MSSATRPAAGPGAGPRPQGVGGSLAWSFGGAGLSLVGGLGSAVLLARALSPRDLGGYFLLFVLVRLLSMIARLGADLAAVRLVSTTRARDRAADLGHLAGAALVLVLGCGSLVAATLLSPVWGSAVRGLFDAPELATLGPACAVWVLGDSLRFVGSEYRRGTGDVRTATLTGDGVRSSVFALLVLGTTLSGSDLLLGDAVSLAASVSLGCGVVAVGAMLGATGVHVPRGRDLRRLLAVSAPLLTAALATLFIQQADVMVVAAVAPAADVAEYGAASRLSLLALVPQVAVAAAILPRVGRLLAGRGRALGSDPSGEAQALLRGASSAVALLVVPPAVLGAVASAPLVGLVYGTDLRGAAPLLAVLLVGPTFSACAGFNSYTLVLSGRHRLVMTITVAVAVVQLLVMLLAGAVGGPLAVAVASSMGVVAQNLVLSRLVRRRVGINTAAQASPRTAVRAVRTLLGRHP